VKPNIVFILADDMGYGDLGAVNGGQSHTPALDHLLAEGVALTHQYSASPVCNPSRACLMTGRYPHRTGSIDTLDWRGYERMALRETTVADLLRGAGYRTGLVGKWHLGAYDPRYHPMNRGFDETICFRGGMIDYYNWQLERGAEWVKADGRYLTDVWTEEAVSFIERSRSQPFFLHLTYNAPHTPLQAPEALVKPFRDSGKFTEEVSTLYAMIQRMDEGVGRVLETLEANGLAENTIVVFTSDNGPQFGAEGHPSNCLRRFNSGLNGGKGSVYEGGIRVPALLRWPAGLPGRKVFEDMVHFSDWFPTLLAMAGVPVPKDLKLDGVNVLPALRGEGGKVCTRRFWQWNRYTPVMNCNAAMRDGDWKLVRPRIAEAMKAPCVDPWLRISMEDPQYFIRNGLVKDPIPLREVPPPPPPELYNIAEDPLERENLADTYPDVARRMSVELETWFEEVEADRASIDYV
jgi:arylsulfatase A-like enzyme